MRSIRVCHQVTAGKDPHEEQMIANRQDMKITNVFLDFWVSAVSRPVDACEEGTHTCDIQERALCTYTGGSSYSCSCLPGFFGDGKTCQGTAKKKKKLRNHYKNYPLSHPAHLDQFSLGLVGCCYCYSTFKTHCTLLKTVIVKPAAEAWRR